jgi:hypothetical protein
MRSDICSIRLTLFVLAMLANKEVRWSCLVKTRARRQPDGECFLPNHVLASEEKWLE